MPTLDVIIPVKNRPFMACVESLQRALPPLGLPYRILICEGGSTQPEVVDALAMLAPVDTVEMLPRPLAGFNKAALLNHGIDQSQAEVLLLSDADIVWTEAAIAALLTVLETETHAHALVHIADVAETEPHTPALHRQRYSYRLEKSAQTRIVHLESVTTASAQRPGCGLVCARRDTFLQLGGYKETFQGWGWEDQDLLIRAEVLDIPIVAAGRVLHQSHPDALRNQFHEGLAPMMTRDRNILACLRSLQRGELWGDLRTPWVRCQPRPIIEVRWPEVGGWHRGDVSTWNDAP